MLTFITAFLQGLGSGLMTKMDILHHPDMKDVTGRWGMGVEQLREIAKQKGIPNVDPM